MRVISNEKGFTFLEMCVVVAIIAILMVMAVPNYQNALANAQKRSCEANKKLIETQLDSYFLENNKYPTGDTGQILVELKAGNYLKDEPHCPVKEGKYTISTANNVVTVTCSVAAHKTTP